MYKYTLNISSDYCLLIFCLCYRETFGGMYLQMVAKGKDASDLFPAVVKNVVSKNIEVKFTEITITVHTQVHVHISRLSCMCVATS